MKNDLDFEELYSVSALNIPLVKNGLSTVEYIILL